MLLLLARPSSVLLAKLFYCGVLWSLEDNAQMAGPSLWNVSHAHLPEWELKPLFAGYVEKKKSIFNARLWMLLQSFDCLPLGLL